MLPLPINEIFGFFFITPSTNIKYPITILQIHSRKKNF
ncbi:hypothetical protein REIS_0670 [Rickettsia endosymbiont of Ixodes scapularis]|nr:hypothetical protein REIS_0670 [Rickettsia endosymbiont of Ixodes scapularis]